MLTMEITLTGPVFRGDASGRVRDLRQRIIGKLLEKGEERLAQTLRPRPAGVYLSVGEAKKGKASTGHYRRNLQTRLESNVGIISDGGVIYGPWLEGLSSRNQTTRFKGYASFRKVGQWLGQEAFKVSDEEMAKFIKEMN